MSLMQRQLIGWCFTLNNYNDIDLAHLRVLGGATRTKYLVFGRELAPDTGTPHLQGFILFEHSHRGSVVQRLLCRRVQVHIEPLNGTPLQATTYCKKDGDFEEFGALPTSQQGKRTDWDLFQEWITSLGRLPTQREIIIFNPSLYARYAKRINEIARAFLPTPALVSGEHPRPGFQVRLSGLVQGDTQHPRRVEFVVDEQGNTGKSWFCRWALSTFPEKVQVLRVGRRDDLAYSVDETKSVFLFDVPRTQMEFFQYSIVEMLKDRLVFSPKYESGMKVLSAVPLVVVFCNEMPDRTKMSVDRFHVTRIIANVPGMTLVN